MVIKRSPPARMMAGIPVSNASLYRRIQFLVGDPTAFIEVYDSDDRCLSTLILRDIEMERARENAIVHSVACPNDFVPPEGLSGDREVATAQAAAEFLVRNQIDRVVVDRSIPMIYVEMLRRREIEVLCDVDWGILERRQKSASEIVALESAQRVTESVMERACRLIANCPFDEEGVLQFEAAPLTSERLRVMIDHWLLDLGFANPESIVAGGSCGGDCHDLGHGPLKTSEPIIVDIFPKDKASLYNGDCTRTVVNGDIPAIVAKMHAAVKDAKKRAMDSIRAGVSGDDVHQVTASVIVEHGFAMGLPKTTDPPEFISMTHGTGHGLGLDVHEPPLLADGGIELIAGDVVTVEPGLYSKAIGGVRIEDVVVVTEAGCRNLNQLHEELDWRS